jgi:hypothetical protein
VLLAVLHMDGGDDTRCRSGRCSNAPAGRWRAARSTALERPRSKGCLRSRMGDPTAERGGKARRYFSVTPLGVRALKAMHASLSNLSRGLEALLEEP